tara:strand:- start:203 stop:1879 length:1677 start_codon:yes stop_codon:yes gene_type:complete
LNENYGRDTFLSLLEDEGVTHIFGNPGTTELAIMHALNDHPDLTYVLGLQEAVVVAMADGYARASGQLAACNVHVAPGLGNAIGSLYTANMSGSPLIVTAGQQEQGHGLTEPLLYGPLVEMARPVVKWAFEISRVEDLPRVIRRAAKIATTAPTGPVFLSLPGDVLNAVAGVELATATRVDTLARPSDEALLAISHRILEAKQPMILVGSEIISSDAQAEAMQLAETLGAPVFQQSVPSGAHFPSQHSAFMGALTRDQKQVQATLSPYDLLICIGADVLQMSVWSEIEPLPSGMPIVQIGLRDWEMGKNYPAEIALRSDVGTTLRALVPILQDQMPSVRREAAMERLKTISTNNWSSRRETMCVKTIGLENSTPINPDWLMLQIAELLPENAIVVDEGLTGAKNLLGFLPLRDRYSYFGMISGGIGWGIAAAVGVQLAQPDRPVVAILGDGSSLYSPQALWSAAHLNLPIIFVMLNNRGYRILKERLIAFHDDDRFIGMDFDAPAIDLAGLSRSLGVEAETVTNPKDFEQALNTALKDARPRLIEVMVEPGPQRPGKN